jgi:hypothetical protein
MYGDVCLRVLCRFAFWKTLFSIALFSALLSQKSFTLRVGLLKSLWLATQNTRCQWAKIPLPKRASN